MNYSLNNFRLGDRVQLHPATDRWMMGDRFGKVVKLGRKLLHVRMDVSGRTIRVSPENIGEIMPWEGR
jgi:hypothetical protein